ncbi:hypothetical protein Dda_3766 [Drechslerella dactyloides]|uniref:Uncharacterized protein n=1 Tax=Drechslerella dactyloides TaxID=74499 RepID=A0AAD6NIT8_DREDA|nr:hypothetical protein Dda_3766 [Drechslerella dactyloides]
MLSRTALRPVLAHASTASRRTFSVSSKRLAETVTAPPAATVTVKKSSGGFRGGVIGFLLGSSLAFATSFTYLRNEWKIRDDILMEDFAVRPIFTLNTLFPDYPDHPLTPVFVQTLRATCQRVEARFRVLEDQIAKSQKK